MKTVEIDASEVVAFAKSLGAHGMNILGDEISLGMLAAAELIEAAAVRKAGANVNTGTLRAGMSSRAAGKGFGTVVSVGTAVEYGAPVEFGSKYDQSVPLRDALARWARRKLSLGAREAEVFAFHFQKHVQSNGNKAHPFLNPAVDEQMGNVEKVFGVVLERAVVKLKNLGGF